MSALIIFLRRNREQYKNMKFSTYQSLTTQVSKKYEELQIS